jgi:hypothetical protein
MAPTKKPSPANLASAGANLEALAVQLRDASASARKAHGSIKAMSKTQAARLASMIDRLNGFGARALDMHAYVDKKAAPRSAAPRPKTYAQGRKGFATQNLKPSGGYNGMALPSLFGEPMQGKARTKKAAEPKKAARRAPKTYAQGRKGFATQNLKPSGGYNGMALPSLFA